MSDFQEVLEEAVPGETGPGTRNNVRGWSVSWDSRTRPGQRASSLSYATRGVASRVAVKMAKTEANVVLKGKWIGGWL